MLRREAPCGDYTNPPRPQGKSCHETCAVRLVTASSSSERCSRALLMARRCRPALQRAASKARRDGRRRRLHPNSKGIYGSESFSAKGTISEASWHCDTRVTASSRKHGVPLRGQGFGETSCRRPVAGAGNEKPTCLNSLNYPSFCPYHEKTVDGREVKEVG